MPKRICGLLCLCVGWAASCSALAAVWSVEHDVLVQREAGTRITTWLPDELRSLSPRSDGGAWLAAAHGVTSLAQDGQVQLHVDVAARGFGNPLAVAADAYDGTAWIATDSALLLHVAADGTVANGIALAAPAAAVAVDLEQGVWVIAHDELLHFGRDGRSLAARPLELGADERVNALDVDAFHRHVWFATSDGLYHTSYDTTLPPVRLLRGVASALALDQRGGHVLAVVDGALVAFDGVERRALDPLLAEGEQALAVVYDATVDAFVVETSVESLRLGGDGRVLGRGPASTGTMRAATPLRVDPTLELLRPPAGGAITDAKTEIILRVGALCNAARCDVPHAYLQQMRIAADVDGIALGEAEIGTSGRARFPLRLPMKPGVNAITATATDMFGHRVTFERARWTLLVDEPAIEQHGASAESRGEAAVPKAANKPPVVTLTSPVSGTRYSTGSAITLIANASDPDGAIAKVEFYGDGTTLIGTASAPPYEVAWANAATGSHSVTAKAYDTRKASAVSPPVTIVVVDNQPPTVAFTAPPSGSFVAAGSSVTLTVNASDPDGTIASVEFFDGATSIGAVSQPPYRFTWNPASSGIHSISARATDERGAASAPVFVDIVVGVPPVVVVTNPVACSTIDGPLDMIVTADALSTTGAIVTVEFFDNGSSIGTATVAPWRTFLSGAPPGDHSITAKAVDDHGLSMISRPSLVTVRAPNQPPSVTITSPVDAARFPFGAPVNLAATASDTDGSVASVDFRLGSASGSLIGRATNAPFAVTWKNVAAGSYAIVAVAYDDRNATTTAAPIHVTVDPNALPTVAITAPPPDARYVAPASVAVTASASDIDGSIVKVEFFAGTTPIGSTTAAPFSVTWGGVAPGVYSIVAKATDTAGAVTTSAPVSITVTSNALPSVALTAPVSSSQFFMPATISLTANATDTDGSIASVDFYANGALIGRSTSAPYRFVWEGAAAGTYALTARATDNFGGVTASTAVNVTIVGAPSVNIDSALAGATINDDNVLVRGFANAPPNSAVTVNGLVTHIDDLGRFQANDIPLMPGSNTVDVVLTTQDGQSASQSITINSSGPGAFVVHASPTEGLESLQVTFTIENPGNTAFKQILFDLDNDGFPNLILTPDQFVDGKLTVSATYPAGTWLAVLKAYDDDDRVIYATSKSIVVLLPQILQGNLLSIYDGMLARLHAGNIAGALTAFTGSAYDKYNGIFTQLQASLPTIVEQLGEVQEVTFNGDLAEFTIVRNAPDATQRFMLYMIRSEDGIWRIDGM